MAANGETEQRARLRAVREEIVSITEILDRATSRLRESDRSLPVLSSPIKSPTSPTDGVPATPEGTPLTPTSPSVSTPLPADVGERGPSPPPSSRGRVSVENSPRPPPPPPLPEPGEQKWKKPGAAAAKVVAEAHGLWKEGGEAFDRGWYSRAVAFHTRALRLAPLPEYFASRSKAHLKLGNTAAALSDSMQSINRSISQIERYKAGVKKRENCSFLEYYLHRGMVFLAHKLPGPAALALDDFKMVSKEFRSLGFWPYADPDGWAEHWEARLAELNEERELMRQSAEEEGEEYEAEPIEVVHDRERCAMALAEVNALEREASEVMMMDPPPRPSSLTNLDTWRTEAVDPLCEDILLPHGDITPEVAKEVLAKIAEGGHVHRNDVMGLLLKGRALCEQEANIVDIPLTESTKVHVIGDIHGQFHDLLKILSMVGTPSPDNKVLFNGDYVDRGAYGMECIIALLLYKIAYAGHVFLARGNHEDRAVNEQYHFLPEVLMMYGSCELYDACQDFFNSLPLGHVIGGKVLVLHGGLPSDPAVDLAQLQKINRFDVVPESGAMCDVVWSDPGEDPGVRESDRNRGMLFGADVTARFLETNGLDLLVRSHDVHVCMENGYSYQHDGKCLTIFSAPNYCGSYGNKGAFGTFAAGAPPQFTSFDPAPASSHLSKTTPHSYHFNLGRH
eukprot:Sspe_Gene.19962::Locus_7301_Transcript_1_2_Confidence_0.500_Length_2561::g.19962::m.19962/K04460/PPP5C; serine/threonine-protein phosphatase 5